MVSVLGEAAVSEPVPADLGVVCQWWTCSSLPRSYCYHHIAHVGSHLLENLPQIRNEVTLTHPVSYVSQEPSRQRARFSPEQLCAIWILLLSFLWLKIALPQGTPVPEGLQNVLLGMSGECWQVKTNSSCGFGDLHRKMWVYLKRMLSSLYGIFEDSYCDLFRTHLSLPHIL